MNLYLAFCTLLKLQLEEEKEHFKGIINMTLNSH